MSARRTALDAQDVEIIALLRDDGRAPCAAIARTVGLSEASIRHRMRSLLTSQTLRITAVIDPSSAGLDRQVVIGIRSADAAAVADALAELAELERIALTAGTYDVLAEAACSDERHLLDLLQRLHRIPQVGRVEAFIALRQWLRRMPGSGSSAYPPVATARPGRSACQDDRRRSDDRY
jgi:Lrp/AsnC family transcriptional regulator, regulator for asnA, asnC and gidA